MITDDLKAAYKEFDDNYEYYADQLDKATFAYFKAGYDFMQLSLEKEHNNYLRALADADNVRKNYKKKQDELNRFKYEDLFKELVPTIYDDMTTCLNETKDPGVEAVFSKIIGVLKTFNVSPIIPEKGEIFNEDTMEAVATLDNKENIGKVIDVLRVGIKYNEKIIRYPQVVVGC